MQIFAHKWQVSRSLTSAQNPSVNEGWEWFVYRQSPGQASFPDQGTQEIAFT